MQARTSWLITSVATAVAAFAGHTQGQGVGPGGPFETSYVLEGIASIPEVQLYLLGTVGSVGEAIHVELDPSGPQWTKHFQNPGLPLRPGWGVAIVENLVISGSLPWTGWDEEIVTENFAWDHFPILQVSGSRAPGLSVDFSPSGSGLAFSFDALLPGTQVQIHKVIRYTGSEWFTGGFTIRESPTPEPSTAVLGAFAVLGLACRRPPKRD